MATNPANLYPHQSISIPAHLGRNPPEDYRQTLNPHHRPLVVQVRRIGRREAEVQQGEEAPDAHKDDETRLAGGAEAV